MNERDWLAERFEENRPHLRAVAYRVLGSVSEADDAVQETWLRLSRSGADEVEAAWAPGRKPRVVFAFMITGGKVTAIEMIGDPERVGRLEVVLG